MKFFESKRGNLYPVSRIERITPGRKQPNSDTEWPARVYLIDGGESGVEIWDREIQTIKRAGETVVPAAPGFVVLGYYFSEQDEDPDVWIDEHPVLAWRMSSYGPAPITLDETYNDELGNMHAILRPDGRVTSPAQESDYDSREKWEAEMERQAGQIRAAAAAKAKAAPGR